MVDEAPGPRQICLSWPRFSFLREEDAMISAVVDLEFTLPDVRPMDRPMAFTAMQLQGLVSSGRSRRPAGAEPLEQIIERVRELRGSAVTWAWGLSLHDLVTWSVRNAPGSAPNLPAPLSFFKLERTVWIPKIVINVCPEVEVQPEKLAAWHRTCRRGSIEFLNITCEHIDAGYLDGKDFKRAFNGAFFCDRRQNTTIFCPTIRDWGFHSWPG